MCKKITKAKKEHISMNYYYYPMIYKPYTLTSVYVF